MQTIKVILDTNVWISILIGKRLSFLGSLFEKGELRVVVSQALIDELKDVISRPKFRKYFSEEAAEIFFKKLVANSDYYIAGKHLTVCRDPKDDYLLELALQSQADFLVTGDDDLLTIQKIEKTAIVSAPAFQKVLEVMK